MEIDPGVWQTVGMILGPGGAAWVAVKVSLNGARQDIRDIKRELPEIHKKVNRNAERISTIEGGTP